MKSNNLGDSDNTKPSIIDLGKQFNYDINKEKNVKQSPVKGALIKKDNYKQNQVYAGGYKMTELPNKIIRSRDKEKYELEEKRRQQDQQPTKFDYMNYFPKKDDIYSKLGIRSDEVDAYKPDSDDENANELDKLEQQMKREKEDEENNRNSINYIDSKFGVQKDEFYSIDDPSIKAQFREKLLGEIENKVDKLHSKRDLLQQKKDNIKIIEKKQKLKISRDADDLLNEKQQYALYKNVDDDVDELIHQKWRKKNPEINQVEDVIDKHREKMKELEQLYFKKKLNEQNSPHHKSGLMYMEDEVLSHLVDGKVELDNSHKKSYRTLNNQLVKAAKYTHRQLQDDEENESDELQQNRMVGSFDGDMYDFEYLRDRKKDRKDLEEMKQHDEMKNLMPQKSKLKNNQDHSNIRNQYNYDISPNKNKLQKQHHGGSAYLSDTSQSIYVQKFETPHISNSPNQKQGKKLQYDQKQKINNENQYSPNKKHLESERDKSIERKKQETIFNERDRKLKKLREDMSQVEKLMQQPGVERKKVYIEPSDKALENVTHTPIEKKLYQHKFEEYQVDQKIKEQNDEYFKKLEKPEFERRKNAKSYEKYKKLHPEINQEFTITDRPIEIKNTYEDIIKDEDQSHIQQFSDQIDKGKRNIEEQKMKNLYNRIISDSKQSVTKRIQKDDEFILKFLFMQIDTSKSGFVSGKEILDILYENKDAIVYFDLCEKTIFSDLSKFKTQRKGLFNIQEFSNFILQQNEISKKTLQSEREALKQQLQIEENPNQLHKLDKLKDKNDLFFYFVKDPVNTYGTCVLNEAKLDVLREIFGDLDTYKDYIVKRIDLMDAIKNDQRIQKILTYPAIKIPIVNRKVDLQSILEQIEKEYTLSDEQVQKSKEYISWNQFFDYFKNYQKPNFILDHEIGSSDEAKIFDIQEDYLQLIQDIFDMIPRVSRNLDYVSTQDFIIAAKKDPQLRSIESEIVRQKSDETGLDSEYLNQTLDRILSDGGEYVQWHEIKLFFSRRGRPFSNEFDNEKSSVQKQDQNLNLTNKSKDEKDKPQQKITVESISPKKKQKVNEEKEYDNDLNYEKKSQDSHRHDILEDLKNTKISNVQDDIAKLRFEGNYNSEDEEEKDYKNEIQNDSEDDDLDQPQYDQLRKLDQLRKGGVNNHKKTAEEAIQDHYGKKRVLIQPQDENLELKEEINEFDKYYKELLQRQKDAQLGLLESLQQKEQLEDPVKYGMLKHTAVDYDKYFGKLIKHKALHEKEKASLTVPKPFQFDQRESTKQKTIYQTKKDQYLQEVQNRDQEEMKKQFKAKTLPTTTKVAMYNNLMDKNKEKREKVRQESVKMTLATQNPFSFYDKDIQKREEKKQKIIDSTQNEIQQLKQIKFKATDAPTSSKVDMMKQMEQEKEENRKKNIQDRKEEQLKSVKEFSRLAGASEQWKDQLKKRETTKTWEEEKCTFAPKVNKEIPETSKKPGEQANTNSNANIEGSNTNIDEDTNVNTNKNTSAKTKFKAIANVLSIKKPPTEPKPPSETKIAPQKKKELEKQQEEPEQTEDDQVQAYAMQEESQENQNEEGEVQESSQVENRATKAPSISSLKKKQSSMTAVDKEKKTTKAEQLLIKQREDEKKKKQQEEDRLKKEQEERDKKLKDRAGEVRTKYGDPRAAKLAQEEMEKQKLKERQEIARQQKQDYQQQVKEMESKAKNKQLLTEAKSHGSSALDKYRKLKPNPVAEEPQKSKPSEEQNNVEKEEQNLQESQTEVKDEKEDIDNISRIESKKDEQAEENYEDEYENKQNEFEDIEDDTPAKNNNNDFDEISD